MTSSSPTEPRRVGRARQRQPGLQPPAGAIDLRDIGLEEPDRVGIDRQLAGERPAAPRGIGAVRLEVALDQPGAAGIESQTRRELVLGQLGAHQAVAETERLDAAVGEVLANRGLHASCRVELPRHGACALSMASTCTLKVPS